MIFPHIFCLIIVFSEVFPQLEVSQNVALSEDSHGRRAHSGHPKRRRRPHRPTVVQHPQTETPTLLTTTLLISEAPIDFEKAKTDIVKNIKRQYDVLRNLTGEFRHVFAKESEQANGIYKNLTKSLSWYFTEPDDKETAELDKALTQFYPFGSKDEEYVDSMAKMELYCSLKEKRIEDFKSWIRRKYRYNMIIQVALNMLLAKIEAKNEYYCNATAHREEYVHHMEVTKRINEKLMEAKNRLIDAAVFIQSSEYQLPKVGRICCAFWNYFKQLTHNIKGSKSVDFVVDMTRFYFSSATRYVCFLYPYGSDLCKDEEPVPKAKEHKYESIILEGALTLGEIVTP